MKSPLFERLEFLDDSVLGLAFTNHIHIEYPNLNLKELRELRAVNVCNEKLARVAVNHGLYQFILGGDPSPSSDVKVKEFSEEVSKEDDPFSYGGSVKARKILSDLVESIAGAVYVDVNFDIQRLWEIFRCLLEPMFTLEDLRQQQEPLTMLSQLGDKLGRRIDVRCCKDGDSSITAEVYLDDTCIASGSAKHVCAAKMLVAEAALRKLSESEPVEKVDCVVVEAEDTKGKSSEICSTEKLQIQTGSSSSLPTTSENPLAYELTPTKMVIDEDCVHVEVEPGDVKGKMFEIRSTEKLPLSENTSDYEMAKNKEVVDKDSLKVNHEDGKGKLSEACSTTRKLQIQTRPSSSLCTHRIQTRSSSYMCTSCENLLTYEMTQNQMGIDEDSLEIEPEDAKSRLIVICGNQKWPMPIYSFEEVRGTPHTRFVCSVKIEIPTIEATFQMKGDEKARKKEAENSSSYHMLRALKSPLLSLVIRNLEMQESLEKNLQTPESSVEKKKNLQTPKSSEEKKNNKRKRGKMI
ncbi:unnamed protein product [Thlaspi arvense]|uniref:RNase III domain-containing protein n=1 Tax=Thlaspi arvense TaxID=13288 RepID=A0AAU9RST1_THLAR|nr:unnamed protein product [Thlaspi arvense]